METMENLKNEPIYWIEIKDGNPQARELADRHYSRKTKGAKLFMGIGKKIVLLTPEGGALFGWRLSKFEFREDNQQGAECTIFRNERPDLYLSSELIKEAVRIARERWGSIRLFTYVNPKKVNSTKAGYCFYKAGWKYVGTNKNGKLLIMEAPSLNKEVK
jgi:hypothetical protein